MLNESREDKVGEQLVATFLQQHLYGGKYGLVKKRKALKNGFISQFEPQKGKEMQTKGVDVTFTLKDDKGNFLRKVYIDEKTALHYPKVLGISESKELPTFAFELESGFNYTGEGPHKGWLLDNNLCTDYYLINWVTLKIGEQQSDIPQSNWYWWKEDNIQKYDLSISSIESCLLCRDKLRSFVFELLKRKGINSQTYNNPSKFKKKLNSKEDNRLDLDGKAHLINNNSLPEKPVNIVVPKSTLIKDAEIHAFSYATRAPRFY